jgi:hypothetical protein
MRRVLCAIALAIPIAVFTQAPADSVSPRAKQLHDRAIVVDSHDDTTQRLIFDKAFDIGKRNPNGNIDIPRMREGGRIGSDRREKGPSRYPRARPGGVWDARRARPRRTSGSGELVGSVAASGRNDVSRIAKIDRPNQGESI